MDTLLHFKFPDQDSLCRSMVRLQEFYESPYPAIRGHVFHMADFEKLYVGTHGAPFSYYEDWNGFNVPGHVVGDFRTAFGDDITEREKAIFAVIDKHCATDRFYLIATHPKEPEIAHETCHAMWYLDDEYNMDAMIAVARFKAQNKELATALNDLLVRDGYDESVMLDEFNAYLATTDLDWWIEQLGQQVGIAMFNRGEPFRKMMGTWIEPCSIIMPMEQVK